MKNYQKLALAFEAFRSCEKANNPWIAFHGEMIRSVMESAPSGSGFDCGTSFDSAKSKPDKLIFWTSFHHMNDHGFYDGWTDHSIVLSPSLAYGFEMKVMGRDRREIKEYIGDVFHNWLNSEYEQSDKASAELISIANDLKEAALAKSRLAFSAALLKGELKPL